MRNRIVNRRRETLRKERLEKKMDELIDDLDEFDRHGGDTEHLIESVREEIDDFIAGEARGGSDE